MKKAKDFINAPYRARWMSKNPEALCMTSNELLKRSWNKALRIVNNDGTAIILMHKRDMFGIILPKHFTYEFNKNFPELESINPRLSISESDLKQNVKTNIDLLINGTNLIINDKNENELCTIACRMFSAFLETDQNGQVHFSQDIEEELNKLNL